MKDNVTGVVWVLTNKQIEAGAKAIAEDMMLPGGGRKKLARVVSDHLDWFDAVEARGLTWGDMSRLLLAAGAHGSDGRAIPVGTLSSTVWRKRSDAASPISRRPPKLERPVGPPLEWAKRSVPTLFRASRRTTPATRTL